MEVNKTFYFTKYNTFCLAEKHCEENGFQVEQMSVQDMDKNFSYDIHIKIQCKGWLPNPTLKVISPSLHFKFDYICLLIKAYLAREYNIQENDMKFSVVDEKIKVETPLKKVEM